MSGRWSLDMLSTVEAMRELEIAARRPDGRLLRFTPVWVVRSEDAVYVRTWYRRESGWYGHASASGMARVQLGADELDVSVTDVGALVGRLREAVDASYHAKYGGPGSGSVDRMVGDEAAQTTLRLMPV